MRDFILYVKEKRRNILVTLFSMGLFMGSFLMYQLPLEAVCYPFVITLFFLGLFFLWGYHDYHVKKQFLEQQLQEMEIIQERVETLKEQCTSENERLLCQMIEELVKEKEAIISKQDLKYEEMADYYTTWVHQIKTPIAALELLLETEDSAFSRRVSQELFRIEQYVEMVLTYLRLDSKETDYMFRKYSLDDIVKQSIRKFSSQFIGKGLRLDYQQMEQMVLTDEKWLSFVIEQLLSNAIKYTKKGTIRIYFEEPCTLCIEDTGMGIAPEDIPRVFEKGYTGYHGRDDKKASGLGLYLCKRICTNLGHEISVSSVVDQGTKMCINLEKKDLTVE